jgi:hypothetical protein
MPTAKRKGNKQPIADPALKKATSKAVDQAKADAKTGNVSTSKEPSVVSISQDLDPDALHLRDQRPE